MNTVFAEELSISDKASPALNVIGVTISYRRCLSIVSELYIGSIAARRVLFKQPVGFWPEGLMLQAN